MAPVLALLPLLSILATHRVAAQAPRLHPDPECLQGQGYPPEGYPGCIDHPDGSNWGDHFPQDEFGNLLVYLDGSGLRDWDVIIFMDRDQPQIGQCGTPSHTMDYQTRCRLAHLPFNMGFVSCNADEECEELIPGRLLDVPGNDTSVARSKRSHARDLSFQNAPVKRQDDCSFSGGDTYNKYGPTQRLTNTLRCPAGATESCSQTVTVSRSISQTNTFGVSTEIGGSFFEVISASVSFSYEYSFTEETSESSEYTVTISPGSDLYLTWTPELECVEGGFSGSCDWANDEGEVCIPKFLGGSGSGEPAGEYNTIIELSPGP